LRALRAAKFFSFNGIHGDDVTKMACSIDRSSSLEVYSLEYDTERSMAVVSSIDSNAKGTPFGL
jgi:hypothetical protein